MNFVLDMLLEDIRVAAMIMKPQKIYGLLGFKR